MPFDLFISRHRSFEDLTSGTRVEGGLSAEDAERAMSGSISTRRVDDTYWTYRPDSRLPWFSAYFKSTGVLVLSISYSNYFYVRNFADAFDLGLRIAQLLNARLFEEVGGREVTAKSIDRLLEPRSEYVAMQVATHRGAVERIERGQGALEFPLGPIDLVGPYFVYQVVAHLPPSSTIQYALGDLPSDYQVVPHGSSAALVVDARSSEPLLKALLRPDGSGMQVWPAFGPAPFSRSAKLVRDLAHAAARRLSGDLLFCGNPVDDIVAGEIGDRLTGLGVEFFEWYSRFSTRPRRP